MPPAPVRADAIVGVKVSSCVLPLGEDASDIGRLWNKLCWAGASVGRSGLSTQAIGAFDVALHDLKAKRAGLPLAKLPGSYRDSVACYNTSGGFLHTPLDPLLVPHLRSSSWCGSKNRWTPTTTAVTPCWRRSSTRPLPPARCWPAPWNTAT